MMQASAWVRVGALLLFAGVATAALWPADPPPAGIAVQYDWQDGRAPVVIMLGGSEGGRFAADHPMTQALLGAGFSVARAAYFGLPGLPAQLDRISLDPFDELITTLATEPEVDPRCIFALGVSKGGELALLLAADNGDLSAVATLVPSHVVFQSSKVSLRNHASWRRAEKPLPFVPYPTIDPATWRGVLGLSGYRAMHERALQNDAAVQRARIPVERITASVLLVGAPNDQVWPSAQMVEAIAERMNGSPQVFMAAGDHYVLNRRATTDVVVQFFAASAATQGCLPSGG